LNGYKFINNSTKSQEMIGETNSTAKATKPLQTGEPNSHKGKGKTENKTHQNKQKQT
jgi:hypothetical protein